MRSEKDLTRLTLLEIPAMRGPEPTSALDDCVDYCSD